MRSSGKAKAGALLGVEGASSGNISSSSAARSGEECIVESPSMSVWWGGVRDMVGDAGSSSSGVGWGGGWVVDR